MNSLTFECPFTHLFADDSVLEVASLHSSLCSVAKGSEDTPLTTDKMWDVETGSLTDSSELGLFAGIVKRKTVLKKGRKPRVSHWKKYWVQIWGTNMLYYPSKNSRAAQRSDVSRRCFWYLSKELYILTRMETFAKEPGF